MSTVGVYENVPGDGDEANDEMDNFSGSLFNELNDDLEMSLENDNPDFLDMYHITPRKRLI